MPFSLAIFDLDGTLVDSLADIAGALNEALEEVKAPPLPAALVRGYIGDGATALVRRALGHDAPGAPASDDLDDLILPVVARFRHHYARRVLLETRPYPGIESVLQRLSAVMPLAVVTNKPTELTRPLLAGLSLERYFSDILADGDGFARKPSPDAGRWLLARHGVGDAAQALMVGDGLPDVRFAHALGAASAAVGWGYVARDLLAAERPRWLLEEPAQLLSIALG